MEGPISEPLPEILISEEQIQAKVEELARRISADYREVDDLVMVGVLKGLIFGWLVALVACFHGYRAAKKDGAEGVGIATNRAIVHGAVLCIVLNLFISWLLYG